MYQIIIKNGKIIDGTGNPWYYGDIGIAEDVIKYIGFIKPEDIRPDTLVIDAENKYVSPGFIDIHTHSDFTVLQHPWGSSKLYQGVTTELAGNCGYSLAPVNYEFLEGLKKYTAFMPGKLKWNWQSMADFYDEVRAVKPALNFLSLVGHGVIRIAVMGFEQIKAKKEDIEKMAQLLEACLDQGAAGMSLGLAYSPGGFSSKTELIPLAEVVRSRSKLLTAHIRDEGDTVEEALQEILEIGEETGVKLHISHLKSQGKLNWHKMDRILELIEMARNRGVEVTYDLYPYTKLNTLLMALLPRWAQNGGIDEIVQNLQKPENKAKVLLELEAIALKYGGWDNIVVASCQLDKNSWCEGLAISEIAGGHGVSEGEAFIKLMIEDKCGVMAVCNCLSEENVEKTLNHPLAMLCSDGKILATEGVLSGGKPHPRNYGAFPRLIAHYVREKEIMALENAVRMMTSYPAQKIGLTNRGILKVGLKADLLVFDRDKIKDKATFEKPHQYSIGIDTVIINGGLTMSEGKPTGVRKGAVLEV